MKKKHGIARYQKFGKKFEIIVDVRKAWAFKKGEKVDIREVLEGEFVYYDANKGLKASESDLIKVFNTNDPYKIAEIIIKQGELLLTAEQRRELIEARRRQIIEFLSRNTIDPRTGSPHPPKRIELALKQARVSIDPFKPFEAQVNEVLKALMPIIPIKMSRSIISIKIPPQYIGKAYSPITKMGKIIRSNYLSDGTWLVEMEIPSGLTSSVIEQVARLTKGNGEVRIIRTS